MYFSSKLTVDPSQVTEIQVVKPTGAFALIIHTLTAGRTSEKEEIETFSALAILQQFQRVMESMGVNNVVRLAKDDFDFYIDTEGKKDDLEEAMMEFSLRVDSIESEVFETLYMILEHEDSDMKYLIEVEIHRRHKMGVPPIVIQVNAVIGELTRRKNESDQQLKNRMQRIFQTQEDYEGYLRGKEAGFHHFVSTIQQNLKKFIRVDLVEVENKRNIIRPKEKVSQPEQIPHGYEYSQPIYHGYHGFGEVFLYAWLWSSLLHSNNIYVNNASIVDSSGQDVMHVGEEGFQGGEGDTLDPDSEFAPPEEGDIEYESGNEFDSELSDAGVMDDAGVDGGIDGGGGDLDGSSFGDSSSDMGDGGGSWLDSFGDSGDWGDFGGFDF